jgi:hypothetical protein
LMTDASHPVTASEVGTLGQRRRPVMSVWSGSPDTKPR